VNNFKVGWLVFWYIALFAITFIMKFKEKKIKIRELTAEKDFREERWDNKILR